MVMMSPTTSNNRGPRQNQSVKLDQFDSENNEPAMNPKSEDASDDHQYDRLRDS